MSRNARNLWRSAISAPSIRAICTAIALRWRELFTLERLAVMSEQYKIRVTDIVVGPVNPERRDMETRIAISEEGAEFLTISQNNNGMMIEINPDEWPLIRSAINKLMRLCK